jgi:hypothetical protein
MLDRASVLYVSSNSIILECSVNPGLQETSLFAKNEEYEEKKLLQFMSFLYQVLVFCYLGRDVMRLHSLYNQYYNVMVMLPR